MKEHFRQHGAAYLVAIAATGAAVLLRWLLDPWMDDQLPLVTLSGAVAATVWYGGYRPALVATVLGFVACDTWLLPQSSKRSVILRSFRSVPCQHPKPAG